MVAATWYSYNPGAARFHAARCAATVVRAASRMSSSSAGDLIMRMRAMAGAASFTSRWG